MIVRVGDKWGTLECIGAGMVEHKEYADDGDGEQYVSNSWKVNSYTFMCACGNKFSVPIKQFRGKRLVKDCGCGKAGKISSSIVLAFSTNRAIEDRVRELAQVDKQTLSYEINEALRLYFETREGEENGAEREL